MSQGYEVATGQAPGLRADQPRARGLARGDGRRHGALHDRAPAEWRVRRRADPVRGDREKDARHAAHDHPEREPHGARLLRDGHQRPPHHLARRRHPVFPQRPAPFRRRRRRLLHFVQQPAARKGRWARSARRSTATSPTATSPVPQSKASRRGDGEGARGRDRGQLHQLAPGRAEFPQRPQPAAAAQGRGQRGRHDLAAAAHGPQRRADEVARGRALRLARGGRQGTPRGRGAGRQGHALRAGVDLALHVHGALVRAERRRLADARDDPEPRRAGSHSPVLARRRARAPPLQAGPPLHGSRSQGLSLGPHRGATVARRDRRLDRHHPDDVSEPQVAVVEDRLVGSRSCTSSARSPCSPASHSRSGTSPWCGRRRSAGSARSGRSSWCCRRPSAPGSRSPTTWSASARTTDAAHG